MRKAYVREITETHVPGGKSGYDWILDESKTRQTVGVYYGVGIEDLHERRWSIIFGERHEYEQCLEEPSFHRMLYRRYTHDGKLESTYIACDIIELSDVDEHFYRYLEDIYGVRQ